MYECFGQIAEAAKSGRVACHRITTELPDFQVHQYAYSATQNNGKITSQTDVISGEEVLYTYDALNRLATAQTIDNPSVTQWGQSYTYDGFGNLTDQNVMRFRADDARGETGTYETFPNFEREFTLKIQAGVGQLWTPLLFTPVVWCG